MGHGRPYCALTINLSFFPLRSRKRKQEEEEEEFDEEDVGKIKGDEYALSDDEDLQSDIESSDDGDEFMSDEGDNRVEPDICWSDSWNEEPDDLCSYQSVDGEGKLFWTTWGGARRLTWEAASALTNGQYELLSRQRKRTITLESDFLTERALTQVPYRELTTLIYFRCLLISFIFNICLLIMFALECHRPGHVTFL